MPRAYSSAGTKRGQCTSARPLCSAPAFRSACFIGGRASFPTGRRRADHPSTAAMNAPSEPRRLSDLTPQQRKSGFAAWLGWMFDGLDMHIYTLVAAAFVAMLVFRG